MQTETLSILIKFEPIIMQLFWTSLVFILCVLTTKYIGKFFNKLETKRKMDRDFETMVPFLENIVKVVLWVVVFLIGLHIWNIEIGPFITGLGFVGAAVGFAAKDSVANFFGGLSIFLDKPFKVGDIILVEQAERGVVEDIGVRSTKIITMDNKLVTIPNSLMTTNPVYNQTGYDPRISVRIPVGVSYDSNLNKVENVVLGVLKDNNNVLDEPSPKVYFTEFGESAVNLVAVATISNPENQVRVTHELIKDIFKEFKEQSIEIPFPQRDINLQTSDLKDQ